MGISQVELMKSSLMEGGGGEHCHATTVFLVSLLVKVNAGQLCCHVILFFGK